jgi:Skp family chaperone for outer membrane proteins
MKTRIYVTILAFFLTITVSQAYAATTIDNVPLKERVANMTEEQKKARLEEIKARVYEIKHMDKSSLTRAERKALKKELKEMNKEARVVSGGVYLSVGAIIIIILVLILIL